MPHLEYEDGMRRREFLGVLGGAAGWPLVALAQRVDRLPRIAVILPLADSELPARLKAFEAGLVKLGWSPGANINVDYRVGAANVAEIREHVSELTSPTPNVFVVHGTPATQIVREIHPTVPVIFMAIADPIGAGFANSYAKPSGSMTGFTNLEGSMGGKWVGLLKEIAPRLNQIALVYNPTAAPFIDYYARSVEGAGSSLGISTVNAPVNSADDIKQLIVHLAQASSSGFVVVPDIFTTSHQTLFLTNAEAMKVPAIYPLRAFAHAGGLVSYGIDPVDLYRRAPEYADRILRGGSPADLPAQAPTKFELVINLKTAKALGLAMPPTLLVRADEVIE